MYFEDFHALLQMDGHGGFVWAAYAMALLVVASVLIIPLRRRRRLLRDISGELRRAGAHTPSGGGS
ncbi:heme exporter protein CcmD [Haliea sp. E17]|uniref:heme exporter protein CcmD n=1 Tax=Haliea sp. E17 TaxID=3401576 RepID=UPI003AAF469B